MDGLGKRLFFVVCVFVIGFGVSPRILRGSDDADRLFGKAVRLLTQVFVKKVESGRKFVRNMSRRRKCSEDLGTQTALMLSQQQAELDRHRRRRMRILRKKINAGLSDDAALYAAIVESLKDIESDDSSENEAVQYGTMLSHQQIKLDDHKKRRLRVLRKRINAGLSDDTALYSAIIESLQDDVVEPGEPKDEALIHGTVLSAQQSVQDKNKKRRKNSSLEHEINGDLTEEEALQLAIAESEGDIEPGA